MFKAPFAVERPERVSQTMLGRLDKCSYSAALYSKHKGGPPTAAMARGTALHVCAERMYLMLMERNEREAPPEVWRDTMQAVLDERVDLNIPTAEQDACRLMAWNLGLATTLDLESVVGIETTLELTIGDWVIRGRLDLCEIANNEGVVTDLKTSLRIPPGEEYENSWQPQLYALLLGHGVPEGEEVSLGKGLNGVHTKEVYPRYRDESGQLATRSAYYDQAHLHDFRRTVESHLAKLAHGVETGEWAASPGAWCGTCAASSECPIPAHLREIKTVGTEGDAQELAQGIGFRERALKADKATLKSWVDEHGEVVVGDERWGFTFTRSERADKEAIQQFIEANGGDVSEFYKPSESTRFGRSKVKEEAA